MPFSRLPKARRLNRELQLARTEVDKLKRKKKQGKSNGNVTTDTVTETETESNVTASLTANNADNLINTGTDITYSPHAAATNLVKELGVSPDGSRVKTLVPFTVAMAQVKSAPSTVKKQLFGKPKTVQGQKYRGLVRTLSKKIKLSTADFFRKRVSKNMRRLNATQSKKLIISFMKRADNSFELPSKKDNIRGETRYALADSLVNLHQKFLRENSDISVSVSAFCKARPPNIKLEYARRQICLCKDHANFALMIDATRVLPKSTSSAIEMADEEIIAKVKNLENSTIKYHQWESMKVEQNGKIVTKVNLTEKTSAKAEFAEILQQSLPAFREHCHRVEVQYDQIHFMKKNLRPNTDVCIQLDYAENWAATYLKEISSAYYDKKMVTVHPMVTHSPK